MAENIPQEVSEELAKTAATDAALKVTPILQGPSAGETVTTEGTMATGEGTTVDPTTLDTTSVPDIATPTPTADVGQVATTATSLPTLQAQSFTGATSGFDLNDLIDLDDLSNQTLSSGALAEAATQDLTEKATVKYQLSELFSGIEEGKPLPAWASPAVRKVTAVMQQRGLGSSSMAAAAMTQAVMESGVSIASQDAQMYGAIQLKNLDNQQQAALQNALQVATMDRQNADARTKAAISNAQALLSIDLKELDAQQQSNSLKYSAITQAALADSAAENARTQLNAKNELQVEEFFTELGVQIDTANINRDVALRQFNISQENAYKEFNATVKDQREKFNANMKFAVDQSNAQWRRTINTANTATLNEANRINVQNKFNASQTALNQLWQQYRDNATFNFTASQSELQRKHESVLKALEVSATKEIYDDQQKSDIAKTIIKVIGAW